MKINNRPKLGINNSASRATLALVLLALGSGCATAKVNGPKSCPTDDKKVIEFNADDNKFNPLKREWIILQGELLAADIQERARADVDAAIGPKTVGDAIASQEIKYQQSELLRKKGAYIEEQRKIHPCDGLNPSKVKDAMECVLNSAASTRRRRMIKWRL